MHPQPKSYFFLLFIVLSVLACSDQKTQDLAEFEIHPDFQLELIAAEPLLFDPVELQFDEAGRAFVLEMPGYPLRDEESRLILLQDKDGDGRYDHRQVFADSLQLASSFMPYKGGMLVAAPPDLLYLKDTNDDGIADDYQVIMSGFSTGNLQHNFNGLTYGLDNWIYAANGGNSGEPYFVLDTMTRLNMRRNDIRFRIDDNKLEGFGRSSGGFKLTFDQWGNLYETHNTEHVSHLVFSNRYLDDLPVSPQHTLEVISDHEEHNLSRIYPIGEQVSRVNHPEQSGYFSGACGITFYGGGAFSESFNDNLFVADVVLNLLHLDVLSPDIASFQTSRMREKDEFLASTQRAFRPVNMTVGPDGALYVIDIHREVIEHPEWIPDELEAEMDLSAGKQQGRIYRITAKGYESQQPTALNPNKLEDLVNAFESKNQWVRMTAQRLLVETHDQAAIAPLETLFSNTENPLAQLHVLWTLEGMGALKNDFLLQAITSNVSGLVENAVKILEYRLDDNSGLITQVIALLENPNARVKMQTALSLSTLNTAHFDQYKDEISKSCLNVLNTQEDQIDQWLSWAVASALKRSASSFCQNALRQEKKPSEPLLNVLQILTKVIGKERNTRDMAILLDLLQQHQDMDVANQATMIDGLTDGWKRGTKQSGPSKLLTVLESLEATGNRTIVHATGNLRKTVGLPVSSKIEKLLAQAKADALNADLPTEERVACVQLVKLDQFDQREELLYQLLDNRQPLVLQKEALEQLRASNKTDVGEKILANWASLGPNTRKGAGDILLFKPQYHDLLLTALEGGKIKVGELNFDLERRRQLLWWSDDESIKKRAEALFSDAGVVTRKEAIEKLRPALQLAGNISKGKEVFSTLCATCHQYGVNGVEVGPNLTEINRKSKETLLHEILDPNSAVDTRYLNHSVSTKGGAVYQGVVEQETDAELVLKMMGGQEVTIPKKDIKEFTSLGLSLMPEGLEAGMSEQDMADLLAFLQGGVI